MTAEHALDFGQRLELAIKALNMSRGGLAAEARADKSLVSRWVSGRTVPRGHYLHVLTRIVAARAPGFTQLHWDAPIEEFRRAIGADAGAATYVADPDSSMVAAGEWLPYASDQSRNETIRDGDRYPGIYIQVRCRFANDKPFAECIPIWREGDQLRVRFDGPFWAHSGRIFILGQQLFMVTEDRAVAEGLWVQIMNGVSGGVAIAMDGILATVPHDRSRAPGATLALMLRIENLEPPYAEPPRDKIKAWQQRVHDLVEAGRVAELSGPEIIRHVTNQVHHRPPDGLVDHILTAPASRGFTVSSTNRHPAIDAAIRRWREVLADVAGPGPG